MHIEKAVSTMLPLCVLACATSLGAAQSAPSQPRLTRMNRAPVSSEILKVHLPRAVKRTLPNGLRVLVIADHRAPQLVVRAYVEGAGGLFDPQTQPGLANMTAQLMTQGTASQSAEEIARSTDTLAAHIRVSAAQTSSSAVLTANGLSSNFDRWFPVAADVLQHPAFPAGELSDARTRQLASLEQLSGNPSFLASKYLYQAVYGDAPQGRIAATPESTRAFTAAALRDFYRQRYTPQNTLLIFCGDITPEKAFAVARKELGAWKRTALKVDVPPVSATVKPAGILLIDRPRSVQTNLLAGRVGIDRRDPDYVKLAVTNNLLGGGAAGRLFLKLREEKSYTYGAYSSLDASDYRGLISASTQVRTPVTGPALTDLLQEMQRLGTDMVPQDELDRHERAMVASFATSLESLQELTDYVYTQEKYGFPADYWDTYTVQLSHVTPADVQAMGKRYYDPAQMQIVAVGDPSIKPALDGLGKVREVKP